MTNSNRTQSNGSRRSAAFFMCVISCLTLLTATSTTLAQSRSRQPRHTSSKIIIINNTGEVSLSQPRVHVQIRKDGHILEGEGVTIPGLDLIVEEDHQQSFSAFLDTGAGAFVISQSTAKRFGIETDPDSVYIDVGLKGETAMHISKPYEIALGNTTGMLEDQPANFFPVQTDARMELNPANLNMVQELIGSIDVIGMPAIRQFVVELDLTPLLLSDSSKNKNDTIDPNAPDALEKLLDRASDNLPIGPAVQLHPRNTRIRNADLIIPLTLQNFNQTHHPKNRGALPSLAQNPMIIGIISENNKNQYKGDWLLDTGAAASIISTAQAQALGLFDDQGNPKIKPAFTLPLAGISGRAESAPGFIIDKIQIKTNRHRILEFRNVHIVVKDISITTPDGKFITLDGVFGMNLLFPSVSGMGGGLPTGFAKPPFKKIWIDTPHRQLALELNQ